MAKDKSANLPAIAAICATATILIGPAIQRIFGMNRWLEFAGLAFAIWLYAWAANRAVNDKDYLPKSCQDAIKRYCPRTKGIITILALTIVAISLFILKPWESETLSQSNATVVIEDPQYKIKRDEANKVIRNRLGIIQAEGEQLQVQLEDWKNPASDDELYKAYDAWDVSFQRFAVNEAKDASMWSRFSRSNGIDGCRIAQAAIKTHQRWRCWCHIDYRLHVIGELIGEHQGALIIPLEPKGPIATAPTVNK